MVPEMIVEQYTVGPVGTNCYFIVNKESRDLLIIDPGAEAERLASEIRKKGYHPVAILLTHGHFDHASGVAGLQKEFPVPAYAYEGEKATLEDPVLNLTGTWMGKGEKFHADKFVKDEEVLNLAGFRIHVFFTPGHTPGGCCYYFEGNGILCSGDTLFQASVGRTDLPGGSMKQLIDGIKNKLMKLPDDTKVLTGHMGCTTIGFERQYNPYIQ